MNSKYSFNMVLVVFSLSVSVSTLLTGADTKDSSAEIALRNQYESYNFERTLLSAIQTVAEDYEINVLLSVIGESSWEPEKSMGDSKGNFEDKEKLYNDLGISLDEHEDFYKRYKDNQTKPLEEYEDLGDLKPLDYLAISNIDIRYYLDKETQNLSQVIRVTSEEKVFRAVVLYNNKSEVINYLEL